MALTPKTKAFAFAGGLLLLSTIMLGTSLASTGTALAPFMRGDAYGHERGMARGHFHGLGLKVGQMVDGELKPLEGATVVVARMGVDRAASNPVATKETDGRGVAIFQLKPGAYKIAVTKDRLTATYDLRLQTSVHLMLAFDSDGTPHWRQENHRQLERRGDMAGLLVRVGENQSGERVPVEGAKVQVYRINDDNTTTLVSENTTGPRGFVAFQLHKGPYLVKVSTDDVSGEHRLRLFGDTAAGVLIDGDEMHWRVGKSDAHRCTDSPPPRRGGR
ncbi:MAG: hypothetical protein HYT80_00765 [Euryarchaeota archaeon]|nr:hypothetical protein [Euryarchaeota archaeon]